MQTMSCCELIRQPRRQLCASCSCSKGALIDQTDGVVRRAQSAHHCNGPIDEDSTLF